MPVFPERFSLANYFLFDRLDEGLAEKEAVVFGGRSWTYQQVADRSRRVAQGLVALGVRPGQRVYIVLPDTPPFAWSIFGVLASGAVLCMGNPDAPVGDLAYVLNYVDAAALITLPRVRDALITTGATLPPTFLVPEVATGEDPEQELERPVEGWGPELMPMAQALGNVPDLPLPLLHRDDMAIWLFTSGSTGRSKAAMHTQRDFAFNTEVYAKGTIGYRRDDRTLSVPRLFFGYATGTNLFFPFAVGATTCLYAERPTPEVLVAAIERDRPTMITNVPTMLGKILDYDEALRLRGAPGLDFSSVRFQLSAGEALPPALLQRFLGRFGGEIYDGIGSAEMFHIYATNRPGDIKPGSLGRVVEGYALKILAEEAEGPGAPELPRGETGVLWVRGDSVALGYHRDRDKSWATFHGRWCRTGDLFSLDEQGYLWFSGRADELLKVGGQWVAPLEVESCLMDHPYVAIAAVIGASDSGLMKPKAFVVLRPEAWGYEEADVVLHLQAHVQSSLSKHKYPRWIVIVDDLPRNDRGKVDRKLLRDLEASRAS
ncbi:MAG TPA: benzoate-CoA ligase family protein [Myxococcota bacterium]|nr:benzoate-CoA ligase family protein [Myxococcota bacterium]